MSETCDVCEKEFGEWAFTKQGKVLCSAFDGTSAWACGDCMAAPTLAAKYKKALEEILELIDKKEWDWDIVSKSQVKGIRSLVDVALETANES